MKLIIENRSDLDELTCLDLVSKVVKMGRISNDDKQYCYLSTIDIGGEEYCVSTDLNKKSDRFIIYKTPKKQQA